MVRWLLAGGALCVSMGTALTIPAVTARVETGVFTPLGVAIISIAVALITTGLGALIMGFRQRRSSVIPSGARAALTANILFLAFFALELSDRLMRRDGQLGYWSTYLLLPALALFVGLVTAQSWAWWATRIATALGILWFLAFLALIPFAPLRTEGVPVPWYGRVYMTCVTLAFAGVLSGAFRSLGRPETRSYFGLGRI